MSTQVKIIQKKTITSDSYSELMAEIENSGESKKNVSISPLYGDKYFATLDLDGQVVPSHEVSLQSKEITENGIYTPDSGYDGFNFINVNVPEVIREVEVPRDAVLQTKEITENGTFHADEGFDGFNEVTVNVPEVVREVEVEKIVEVPAQPVLQSKTATENGIITPDEGFDGLSSVTVNVSSPAPQDFDEESWQQYQNWKLVHFTNYMGPESEQESPEDVYSGSKITISVSEPSTIVSFDTISGSIEWGDGSYQEITEESKNKGSGNNKYDSVTHQFVSGTYTIYFSEDFELRSNTSMSFGNSKIISFGGKIIKDFRYPYSSSRCFSQSLTLEEGLVCINDCALQNSFSDSYPLYTLTLPVSLESIGKHSFESSCIKNILLPLNGNLSTIGDYAFNSSSYKDITIPLSVQTIGISGLGPVKNLKILVSNPKQFSPSIFSSIQNRIYVPWSEDHSVLNAYKTADGWSSYAGQIYESDPE